MLIVIAVIGIMVSIAVPGFNGLLQRSSLTSKMNEMVGSIQLARSEAITRNERVTICRRKADGSKACDSAGGWQNGWLVFTNPNNNGSLDSGEVIVGVGSADSSFSFKGTLGSLTTLTFRPDGSAGGSGTRKMVVCKGTAYEGEISIDVTGRPGSRRLDSVVNC